MDRIYLVSYDIESNKLRLKFSKKLQALGLSRVQYSLFLGNLSPTLYQNLTEIVNHIWLDATQESDRIDVLPITRLQVDRMLRLGGEHLDMEYITGQKHTMII